MTATPQAAQFVRGAELLECVVNVSEGRDQAVLAALAEACGPSLLDVHSDAGHHRSVFTLAGPAHTVEQGARALASAVVSSIDLGAHQGAHPRFGALDVVPWVALEGWPLQDAAPGRARQARDDFARWAARELALPVFLYGQERSLPELRRQAWRSLRPDLGPGSPHPTAGAVAAGCRQLMVAYNLWMAPHVGLEQARTISSALRSRHVRALTFVLEDGVQVSCNLLQPLTVGPAAVWDRVVEMAPVDRAELVGLVPQEVLSLTPKERWSQLDLAPGKTIEQRLQLAGARTQGD